MSRISRRLILLLACSVLLLAPLITVQLATGAGRAHACKCSPPPPPSRPSTRPRRSFRGGLCLSRRSPSSWSSGSDRTESYWSIQLDVDKVWKGPVASTTFVYVWHGPACGYGNFEIGEDFLVYSASRTRRTSTLFVSFCSRTIERTGTGPPDPVASEDEEQAWLRAAALEASAAPSRERAAPDPTCRLRLGRRAGGSLAPRPGITGAWAIPLPQRSAAVMRSSRPAGRLWWGPWHAATADTGAPCCA